MALGFCVGWCQARDGVSPAHQPASDIVEWMAHGFLLLWNDWVRVVRSHVGRMKRCCVRGVHADACTILSLPLSLSHALSLSLSLSHTHKRSRTHTHSLSFFLSLSFTHSCTHAYAHVHAHTRTPLSLSSSHSNFLILPSCATQVLVLKKSVPQRGSRQSLNICSFNDGEASDYA